MPILLTNFLLLFISLKVADSCTPFNSGTADLSGVNVGGTQAPPALPFLGIAGLESNRALGVDNKPALPIATGNQNSIVSASQLFCYDFDEKCRWKNMDGILVDELDWFQGIGYLDENRIQVATGTRITPEGYYAIAASERVLGMTGKAILVSDVIQCQRGMADLKFSYWTSPKVQLRVCTKKINRLLPDYEQCSGPIEDGDPGPALIPIPDQGQDSFQIYIIAENFVWQAIGMQGGFAVIDSIEYRGQMCGEDYSHEEPQGFTSEEIFEETPPPLPPVPNFSAERFPTLVENQKRDNEVKEYPYELPKKIKIHKLEFGPEDIEALARHFRDEPRYTLESTDSANIKESSKDFPQKDEVTNSDEELKRLHVKAAKIDANDMDMIGNNTTIDESEVKAVEIPDACEILSCPYNKGACIEYTKQGGWLVSDSPVGNPLTGIRGDATVLPYNKDGSFAYLEGPKNFARLVTPAFDLAHDVYFVFAYHKAPTITKESRRWFREGKVLQRALYQYIAFEVRNLTSNNYIGIDELMILDSKRQPFCAQSELN
ncbi:unnamed protein product, partial [Mesorhabditis belari]|uniref:MAM domain-containing protein n=1 Tax=Mesorhabditis belari TaxID=2138241 RepID=A0AAF3EUP5_9BILA